MHSNTGCILMTRENAKTERDAQFLCHLCLLGCIVEDEALFEWRIDRSIGKSFRIIAARARIQCDRFDVVRFTWIESNRHEAIAVQRFWFGFCVNVENIPMLHGKLDGVANAVCDVVDDELLLANCGSGDGDEGTPIVESTEPGSL